jgi:hypothetical protein
VLFSNLASAVYNVAEFINAAEAISRIAMQRVKPGCPAGIGLIQPNQDVCIQQVHSG